jgi:hypothetical protein
MLGRADDLENLAGDGLLTQVVAVNLQNLAPFRLPRQLHGSSPSVYVMRVARIVARPEQFVIRTIDHPRFRPSRTQATRVGHDRSFFLSASPQDSPCVARPGDDGW